VESIIKPLNEDQLEEIHENIMSSLSDYSLMHLREYLEHKIRTCDDFLKEMQEDCENELLGRECDNPSDPRLANCKPVAECPVD